MEIRGIRTLNLQGFDLSLRPGTLTVVSGPAGSGKSALLFHTCYALAIATFVPETERQHVRPRLPVRPRADSWYGVLPAVDVGALTRFLPEEKSLADFLDFSRRWNELIRKHGVLRCSRSDCGLSEGTPERTFEKVQAALSGEPSRVMLGADCSDFRRTDSFEKIFRALVRRGVRRFVWDGRFVRLAGDDGESAPKAPKRQLIAIFDSVHPEEWSRLRADEAQRFARDLGAPVLEIFCASRDSHFESLTLGSSELQWFRMAVGGVCAICGAHGLDGPPRAAASGEPVSLWLDGQTQEAWLKQPFKVFTALFERVGSERELPARNLLKILEDLDLDRIEPARMVGDLSSGEKIRVTAAFLEAGGATDTLMILDEPERVLGGNDLELLYSWSRRMCALGNTLLVSERKPQWSLRADAAYTLGPGSGVRGGCMKNLDVHDITEHRTESVASRSSGSEVSEFRTASVYFPEWELHREFEIPVGAVCALVGASGTGKSLFLRRLTAALQERRGRRDSWRAVKYISPLREGERTIADATGVLDSFAEYFAALPAARRAGWTADDFTLKRGDGRCEACRGLGRIPDNDLGTVVPCDACGGARYKADVLLVTLQERNIADVLSLTVSDALRAFSRRDDLASSLQLLDDIGLGSVRLDSSLQDISESERFRLSLFEAIRKRAVPDTIFLCDEPFAGMDDEEIERCLALLRARTGEFATFLFSSHQLAAIVGATYVLEMKERAEIKSAGRPSDYLRNSHEALASFSEMREK